MSPHWLSTSRSLPRCSGSIQCSIRCGMIRASKNSRPRKRRNHSENFSEKFGREECVILRQNTKARCLPEKRRRKTETAFWGLVSECRHLVSLWENRRRSFRLGMNNFFSELKRRNVYKVAVAYAVVTWLLIQAASIFFPAFDAPPWVMKMFIVVIILCFPIALVLSWAFEITPTAGCSLRTRTFGQIRTRKLRESARKTWRQKLDVKVQ